MANSTCIVDDCEKLRKSRGLCSAHYQRWRVHGEPEPLAPRVRGFCEVATCNERHHCRGFCLVHYDRWRRYGDPEYQRPPRPVRYCSIEDCDRIYYCRGWCKLHYNRWAYHQKAITEPQRTPFNLSDLDAAWLAGLFEGEGCIHVGTGKSSVNSVSLTINMTDRDIIQRVCDLTVGGGPRLMKRQQLGWKDQWGWSIAWKPDVEELLTAMLPWFGQRRREKALEALERLSQQKRPQLVRPAAQKRKERGFGALQTEDTR